MHNFRFVILAISLASAVAIFSPAHAENGCPIGFMPMKVPVESSSDCGPIPNYYDEHVTDAEPQREWVSRWGAIALGSTASGTGTGVARNAMSKKEAERVARSGCLANGGGEKCLKDVYSYRNQCAVVVWGSAYYSIRSAATIDQATEAAMRICSKNTTDCQLYYSDCSYPVLE